MWATERNALAEKLTNYADPFGKIPPAIDAMAKQALRDYALIGGMPEAVSYWSETGFTDKVDQVHSDLWQSLAEDIQKYSGRQDTGHIEAAFSALRLHYGLRFKYENFAPGYKSSAMKSALDKLEGARIIHRAIPTVSVEMPLNHKSRSAPKLFPLDIGLACHSLGLRLSDFKNTDLDDILNGRIAEIFVAQQLLSLANPTGDPLYFWVRDQSSGNAELDFLLTFDGNLVPIEVKTGATGSLKSMQQFVYRASQEFGLRLYCGELKHEQHQVKISGASFEYTLLSAPLYLTPQISKLLANSRNRSQ